MPDLKAWARWQAAAGPWRGWAICPCLMVGDGRAHSRHRLGGPEEDVSDLLEGNATAVVLDLEPVRGVLLAAATSQRRLAHVVLVLRRWPHANAVLACGDLVRTLVDTSRHLTSDYQGANVVFVLDADRRRSIRRPPRDPRVDNRYDLGAEDLPDLKMLRGAGIGRIVKVSPRR